MWQPHVIILNRQKEAITRTSQKAREEVAKIEQLRQQYEEAEKKRLQELSVSNSVML